MKSKIDILKQVCRYSKTEDIEMSDDITIEEALEAMEQYAASRIEGLSEEQQRKLLIAFVKDWYKDNPLVSEEKQIHMVDKFIYSYNPPELPEPPKTNQNGKELQ